MFLNKIFLKKDIVLPGIKNNILKLDGLKKYKQFLKSNKSKLHLNINQKNCIKYVITVKYFKTGVSITASTISGETILFCVSKPSTTGKNRRINKKVELEELIKPLLTYCPFLEKSTIALHLVNVGFSKRSVARELSKYFIILVFKIFNTKPYNGCRKPKNSKKKKRTKKSRRKVFSINQDYLSKKLD